MVTRAFGHCRNRILWRKRLKRKENPLRCVGYVLAGTIFTSIYEPFALIFCTLFLLAYLVEFKPSKMNRLHLTFRALLLGATPLILVLCSKISLIGINAFYPDWMSPSNRFNMYSGSKLHLSSPLLSLRVAANHFIGATIFGHITSSLTWPHFSSYQSAPRKLEWPFAFLNSSIALLSFFAFSSRYSIISSAHSRKTFDNNYSSLLLGIGFLLATACMVIPASFTAKYQSWLVLSGYSWSHTFLTGSLSTSLGAASISSLLYFVIERLCKTQRRQRLAAIATTLVIFTVTQKTFDHNYIISLEVNRRAASLSNYVFYCRNNIPISPSAEARFNDEPPNLPQLKILCANVRSNPATFSNWGSKISIETKKDQWAPRKIAIFIDLTKGNKKTLQWESLYISTFVYS
jgi:hypothetical protein